VLARRLALRRQTLELRRLEELQQDIPTICHQWQEHRGAPGVAVCRQPTAPPGQYSTRR
jgi:hypothetical protein